MTQITILSGVERRRRWSDERKLALVEAAIVPGASVAAIARDADISPSSIRTSRSPELAIILTDMDERIDTFFAAAMSGWTPNLAQMAEFKNLIARCRQAFGG